MDPTTALAGLDAHPWAAVPYLARVVAAWAVGRTREGGAVRAQLLDLAGDHEAAVTHCRAAAEQTTSRSEREHLLRQAHRTSCAGTLDDARPQPQPQPQPQPRAPGQSPRHGRLHAADLNVTVTAPHRERK